MRRLRCLGRRWRAAAWTGLLLCFGHAQSGAQELEFHPPASVRDERAMAVMRDLAERVLPVYQETHPERYMGSLSALQLIAGDYAAADATRQSLRARRLSADSGRETGAAILFDIYAHARTLEAKEHVPFEQAFSRTYREVVSGLGDRDAYAITGAVPVALGALEKSLQEAFNQRRDRGSIALADAVRLVMSYLSYDAHRHLGSLLENLGAEDDRRRYLIEDKVVVRSADGARVPVLLVRPRAAAQPLPTLLEFTIYADARNFARECAARGYVGVVAYARGRGGANGAAAPFAHDGADARAVIDWIARQAWSDGRVAMYGDGYSAFAAWATVLNPPAALKAMATSDATAPGIDFPMVGNIFRNDAYRWLSELAGPRAPVEGGHDEDARWRALYRIWYLNGDACADLDGLFGRPSWILHRWLGHPSYDGFWQAMIPYREQFARIDLPVLSISGYFADAEVGALYYFQQHNQFHPHANQTLLIGPYEDGAMQREPSLVLASEAAEPIDPVAAVDLRELRYQWFDHVLRGAARPALLADRVNYEIMGGNEWRHVASLQAMGETSTRFYLHPGATGDEHRLVRIGGEDAAVVRQTVDLADRSDADGTAPAHMVGPFQAARGGAVFVSEPIAQSTEVSGLFAGRLDFVTNKWDMDLTIALYEQRPDGERLALFDPRFEFRASYAGDRVHRHTLRAGERQQLEFHGDRLMGRRLQAGSRLVMVLGINKRADQEINYGAADDVRAQYVENGAVPVKIRWYGSSYIDIPMYTPGALPSKP